MFLQVFFKFNSRKDQRHKVLNLFLCAFASLRAKIMCKKTAPKMAIFWKRRLVSNLKENYYFLSISLDKIGCFSFMILVTVMCIHIKQAEDNSNIKIQELDQIPVVVNKYPKMIGPKKPPRPPNIPTIPPTTPTSVGKYSGICL